MSDERCRIVHLVPSVAVRVRGDRDLDDADRAALAEVADSRPPRLTERAVPGLPVPQGTPDDTGDAL